MASPSPMPSKRALNATNDYQTTQEAIKKAQHSKGENSNIISPRKLKANVESDVAILCDRYQVYNNLNLSLQSLHMIHQLQTTDRLIKTEQAIRKILMEELGPIGEVEQQQHALWLRIKKTKGDVAMRRLVDEVEGVRSVPSEPARVSKLSLGGTLDEATGCTDKADKL